MTHRTLVIETATAACSVALIEDGDVVARRTKSSGAGMPSGWCR